MVNACIEWTLTAYRITESTVRLFVARGNYVSQKYRPIGVEPAYLAVRASALPIKLLGND